MDTSPKASADTKTNNETRPYDEAGCNTDAAVSKTEVASAPSLVHCTTYASVDNQIETAGDVDDKSEAANLVSTHGLSEGNGTSEHDTFLDSNRGDHDDDNDNDDHAGDGDDDGDHIDDDDSDDGLEHPGEMSIGKKLFKFFST